MIIKNDNRGIKDMTLEGFYFFMGGFDINITESLITIISKEGFSSSDIFKFFLISLT